MKKRPDDFPTTRVMWLLLPWWLLLAYCLYCVLQGKFFYALMRLIEWRISLSWLTWIYAKMFIPWAEYDEAQKNRILKVTNFLQYYGPTRSGFIEGLLACLWMIFVFLIFRKLNI